MTDPRLMFYGIVFAAGVCLAIFLALVELRAIVSIVEKPGEVEKDLFWMWITAGAFIAIGASLLLPFLS